MDNKYILTIVLALFAAGASFNGLTFNAVLDEKDNQRDHEIKPFHVGADFKIQELEKNQDIMDTKLDENKFLTQQAIKETQDLSKKLDRWYYNNTR